MMEERIIFIQWPGDNKWEHYSHDPDKLVLRFPNHGAENLFYIDSNWYSNFKDDGQEYYIYEEADVDDDDDFYGGEFMIGDTWEDD